MFAINRKTGRKITEVYSEKTFVLRVVEDSFPEVPDYRGERFPEVRCEDDEALDAFRGLCYIHEISLYVDEDGNECGADDLIMTDEDPNPDKE